MAKSKTAFFCRSCGAQAPKWMGRCSSCGEWNTLVEEVVKREESGPELMIGSRQPSQAIPLFDIEEEQLPRIHLPDMELERVLGGGLVPGSITLLGGEPGIGKSTLMLQLAMRLLKTTVLYVSGEESLQQIRMRASRLGPGNMQCHVLNETGTREIFAHLERLKPQLIIIDSVQTLVSDTLDAPAGSISQVKECAAQFHRYAKQSAVPVVLIGHITKDGSLAGPKVLEHMVDTVLEFSGDHHHGFRLVRSLKNRFGSTAELGIYEMRTEGLREVSNPSELLLSQGNEDLSGVAVCASLEGMRPLMIEAQALVSASAYGTAQRSSTGFDIRRLHMLLAVLEKRSGYRLGAKDVFLNITGGLRVDDPASDLAVVAAILSSYSDAAIDRQTCFAGEVGLSGEIRPVSRIEQRITEAARLGFRRIFLSTSATLHSPSGIEIVKIRKIDEVIGKLFG
jgi:DNA repair protein RadA/Sms